MKDGRTATEFAAHIGVGRKTLYNWANAYSDFSEAFHLARTLSNAYYHNMAKQVIDGSLQISKEQQTLLLKRLVSGDREEWAENPKELSENAQLEKMSQEKMDEEIKRLFENPNLIPINVSKKK